jgi:hypothetical protein
MGVAHDGSSVPVCAATMRACRGRPALAMATTECLVERERRRELNAAAARVALARVLAAGDAGRFGGACV